MDNRVLTGKILEAAFEVSNELGCGFVESVYKHSLLIALQDKGLQASAEVPIGVDFRGRPVGKFFADIVVEGQIIIELKAVKEFTRQHFAQLLNYLRSSGLQTGLIINFAKPKIDYRRFDNRFLS